MEQLPQEIAEYLRVKGFEPVSKENLARVVIGLLEEKDETISNLSQQITKYKCEDIKSQKLIKSLQDKVTQLAPSISDTGSQFMMASEFKSNFEQLLTTAAPSALADVVDRPFLFSKCLADIISHTQQGLENKFNQIVKSICDLLRIDEEVCTRQTVSSKIGLSLLKIFQQFWQSIFPFEADTELIYTCPKESMQLVKELNGLISSEDFLELRKQLHKIIVYMLLQEKKWEFANLNSGSVVKYSKKEHTCLDGWVKEGEDALLLLEGLRRDGHMHPSLRNYVIPMVHGEQAQFYGPLRLRNKSKDTVSQVILGAEAQEVNSDSFAKLGESVKRIANTIPNLDEQSSLLLKNKSEQIFKQPKATKENKENNGNYAVKRSKKKEKKPSLQTSLKSPKSRRRHEDSLRIRKMESEEHLDFLEDKIQILKEETFSRKKNSTTAISKNISNSHDIIFEELALLPLRRKPLEELPVSKELPLRKKTKPATSRKNSVGKIVSQHIINQKEPKEKENCQNYGNGKAKAKEKAYKDIIKEKLIDEKCGEKGQLSLSLLHAKPKTDREKKREQNRPLKIQGNASKLREKYMS